jgi:hypothetical protein
MVLSPGRHTIHAECSLPDARAVIRHRTSGLLGEVGSSIGVTPTGETTGIILWRRVHVRPRPRDYPPARGLFSPSIVGKLVPRPGGGCDFNYRISRGLGMIIMPVLAIVIAAFGVIALTTWTVFALYAAAMFAAFLASLVFLYFLTRTVKPEEDRVLARWVEDVSARLTAPSGSMGSQPR